MQTVKVAKGFEIGMTESGPYLADGSGNAYFVSNAKEMPLREKALANLLIQLYDEHITTSFKE
jgi:hypothetical protein